MTAASPRAPEPLPGPDGAPEPSGRPPTLRKAVFSGLMWTGVQTALTRAIGLLTTMVLLRYLSPRDFGLLAAALVVLNLADAVADAGLNKELIQRQERIEAAYDTAFSMILGLNVVLVAAAIAIGYGVAHVAREPALGDVVAWMSLTLLFSAAGLVPMAALQKQLMFRQLATRELAGQFAGGAVAVAMAMLGFGVASLVARPLVGASTALLLVWWLCPYRPRLRLDRDLARSMLRYGRHMVAATLMTILAQNLDRVAATRFAGLAALGSYAVALTLVDAPFRMVTRSTGQVLFPVFALLQHDPPALQRAYVRGLRASAAVLLPALVALAVLAPPLLAVLYQGRWDVTAGLLPWLAAGAGFAGMTTLAGEVFKATGRPGYVSWFSLLHLAALFVLLVALGRSFGLTGVAAAYALSWALRFVLETSRVGRLVLVRPARLAATCVRPLACAAAAFGAAGMLLPARPSLSGIALAAAAGSVAYVAALWMVDRPLVEEALDAVRGHRAPG